MPTHCHPPFFVLSNYLIVSFKIAVIVSDMVCPEKISASKRSSDASGKKSCNTRIKWTFSEAFVLLLRESLQVSRTTTSLSGSKRLSYAERQEGRYRRRKVSMADLPSGKNVVLRPDDTDRQF